MRGWPTLGLRWRLVASLVLVGAVTLGVAAIAVLSPLERRLQLDQVRTLESAARSSRGGLEALLGRTRPTAAAVLPRLRSLDRSTGAAATLLRGSRTFATTDADQDTRPGDEFVEPRGMSTTSRVSGRDLFVAMTVRAGGAPYVLVLHKRLTDVVAASRVVRRAFVTAGIVSLLVALVLGLGLATALLRRLGRLRDAARNMSEHGPQVAPPRDTGRDEIGELTRAFAAMQDGLRRQEDARRTFVATASHELRTPLAALQGTLELLGDDLADDAPDLDDARAQVASAHEQAQRLSALSLDLLDLSRLDAELPLRAEPVQLDEIAHAVVSEFQSRADAHHTGLTIEGTTPLWARCDPSAVARILRILVDNALRFAPRETTVTVTLRADGARAVLRVADCGPGVPEDERSIVFERFRRGRVPGGGGFGLGLAIGRALAERMGGGLELESGVAPGASFALSLPRQASPVDADQAVSAAGARNAQ